MSTKQLAANRQNAQKSTGPKTANGKTVSSLNAVKHGILSKEVLVNGSNLKESRHELTQLHQRFWDELQPVGPVEEMLVDQIVTAHWRLRRALTAEAGEIALSVDEGQWFRKSKREKFAVLAWDLDDDPYVSMRRSAFGNFFIESQLREVCALVEAAGELTESAIEKVKFRGKPYGLTRKLEELRRKSQENPEGLSPENLRLQQKERVLDFLKSELAMLGWQQTQCEQREEKEEELRQSAAVLPSLNTLEKIMRYETKLDRQLYRAMAQLERLQRMRKGETIPAPMAVAIA